jgi:hypothetical protein
VIHRGIAESGASLVGRKKHSKESIITTLQNLAASLKKDTLSKQDVNRVLPASSINTYFGSLGNALEAAGLCRASSSEHLDAFRSEYSNNDLFISVFQVEQQVGREPKAMEYTVRGAYSIRPFRKRFGPWPEVLKHYRKWKQEQNSTVNPEIVVTPEQSPNIAFSKAKIEGCQPLPNHPNMNFQPAQLYGEPIDFRGLRHAPINEQGVVYLFGMVSRELGFYN